MNRINLYEAKRHLSQLVDRAAGGGRSHREGRQAAGADDPVRGEGWRSAPARQLAWAGGHPRRLRRPAAGDRRRVLRTSPMKLFLDTHALLCGLPTTLRWALGPGKRLPPKTRTCTSAQLRFGRSRSSANAASSKAPDNLLAELDGQRFVELPPSGHEAWAAGTSPRATPIRAIGPSSRRRLPMTFVW